MSSRPEAAPPKCIRSSTTEAITIKYRKLRNQATAQIKTDKKKANSERINKAKSESEIWKVIADITKPNSLKTITLNENNVLITDEKTVANTLNEPGTMKVCFSDHPLFNGPVFRPPFEY